MANDLTSILVAALALWTITGSEAFITAFDKKFTFECKNNEILETIQSEHNNRREDRRYNFFCEKTPDDVQLSNCKYAGYANELDGLMVFQCKGDSLIIGVESYHDNKKEDRRYNYKCCTATNAFVHDCRYTGFVNGFDGPFTYRVPHGFVIKGVFSYHDNRKEDRRFQFNICRVTKKTP